MIIVLLAAYNEEPDLPGLLEEFSRLKWPRDYRIVLVDDGSTDATAAVAEGYRGRIPLTLLRHPRNRGLGRALQTGLSEIARVLTGGDALVTLDADGTHPPDLIPAMLAKHDEGYDIVIASRFAAGGREKGLGPFRKFLSRAAGVVLAVFAPVRGVRDYTCGYRMFSGTVLRKLYGSYGERIITEQGFAATVELLLKAGRYSGRIAEVPLALDYGKKRGKSKMKVFRTVVRYFVLIIRSKIFSNLIE